MPKVYIKLASRESLELMAEHLAREIEAGQTHNAAGESLPDLLEQVFAQIPEAPRYEVEDRRRR